MAAAITGFALITETDGIVRESLNSMMYQGQWGHESTMDWVQQTVGLLLHTTSCIFVTLTTVCSLNVVAMMDHLIGKIMANSPLHMSTQRRLTQIGNQQQQHRHQHTQSFLEIECHNHAAIEIVATIIILYVAKAISLEAAMVRCTGSFPKA